MRIIERMVLALMPQLGHVLLRGGKGGGGGTTVEKQELDPDVKAKWESMYAESEKVHATPYEQYQGQMIAGFTPEQLKSFSQYEQGVGTGLPALNQAVTTATGLTGQMPTDATAYTAGKQLSDYFNPYTDQVIKQSTLDMDRARQLAMNQMGADATAAGAFGGSRHGVAEAETNKNYFDAVSSMVSGQQQAGYADSFDRYMQDLGLQTEVGLSNQQAEIAGMQGQGQAAQLLAGLSGQERDLIFGDANIFADIGAEKQAMEQSELDLLYGKFMEEQAYPEQQLQHLQTAFGLSPQTITMSEGKNTPDKKGDIWQGMADSFSDLRLKTNIQKINGYRYNFKGDPRPTGGVMAQELEKVLPATVRTDPETGYKKVDYTLVVAELIETVKEMHRAIATLAAEIDELKNAG